MGLPLSNIAASKCNGVEQNKVVSDGECTRPIKATMNLNDHARSKRHIVNIITSVTGECPSKTSALLEMCLLQHRNGQNDNYGNILNDSTHRSHSFQPAAA